MKDMHSHLLPGVDDGAKTMEDTINMLLHAKSNGVTDIMLTPHYIYKSKYSSPKNINLKIFEDVKEEADKIGINVYLGNEIYLSDDMDVVKVLKSKKFNTLNNSRYILVEIPMHKKVNNLKSIFFEIINLGYIPILAHPERYSAYFGDFDLFLQLRSMGVLMQVNFTSLLGDYGPKANYMAKELLKRRIVSFLGSDMHELNERKYEKIKSVMFRLRFMIGKDRLKEITEDNFFYVINNEDLIN